MVGSGSITSLMSPWMPGPLFILVGALAACGTGGSSAGGRPPEEGPAATGAPAPEIHIPAPAAAADQPPPFANRVWKVAASSGVEPGTLYVFLGDGTLLITSSHGTPSLGRWEAAGKGVTLVEEGQRYPTEVLALTADTFGIRVRSPGTPLDITLVPAK
jgi:hypothetical protein